MKIFKNKLICDLRDIEEWTFWLVIHSLHSGQVIYWRFRDQRVLLEIWSHFGLVDGFKVVVARLSRRNKLTWFSCVISVWLTRELLSFVNNWIVTFSHFYLNKIYFSFLFFRFHWILRLYIGLKLFIVRYTWLLLKESWGYWHHYDSLFLRNSH